MNFWDSSAILPLLLDEERSSAALKILHGDLGMIVWCLCEVEFESAISRRVREGMTKKDEGAARSRLRLLAERWSEVTSLEPVRRRALRLLRTHPLRAADSLQLASALVACDENPEELGFVCLDERLTEAAHREGFRIVPFANPD